MENHSRNGKNTWNKQMKAEPQKLVYKYKLNLKISKSFLWKGGNI